MSIYMTGSYFYNKIILIVALASFLIVGFFPLSTAFAVQGVYTGAPSAGNSGATTVVGGGTNTTVTTDSKTGKTDIKQGGTPAAASKNDQIYCVRDGQGTLDVLPDVDLWGCGATLAFLILQISSWVLWVAAILFNATINYTLNMAAFIKDIPIVDLGWTVFRDVTNLLFIFIILYIAINTIVGNEGYGIKKLLGKVIIGAMLINFSLFFTQAMVDASNIFALQFYHKITQDAKGANIAAGSSANNKDYDSGISAAFVNAMGLQQIYQLGKGSSDGDVSTNLSGGELDKTKIGLNASNLIIVGLGGTVLVLITAFVFFAGTMMLLARTVVLVFLMILSPIAFMGNILPALGKYTGEWWSKLTSNLLFAPVYMMLLYLVINMVTGKNFNKLGGGNGTFADLFAGGDNWVPTLMTFVILIMLMVGCLMIAGKLGVIGGKWAEKTGMGLASGLGMSLSGAGLVMGAGSGIARGGLGAVSGIGESKFIKGLASSKVGRVMGGGAVLRGFNNLKDVKVGGKSYSDKEKQATDNLNKEYELLKDTKQGRWESKADFETREKLNQHFADRSVGVMSGRDGELTLDADGKIQKKEFGAPRIFGSNRARKAAQKKISDNRGKDVDKSIKKPYEDDIRKAKIEQKKILAGGYKPGDATHVDHVRYEALKDDIKEAVKAVKDINGAFVPPSTT